MNAAAANPGYKCSECGAKMDWPSSSRCWLCGGAVRPKAQQEQAVPAILLDASSPCDRRATFQLSISTMLLLMTLTAVLGGVTAMAPGLGIALAVFTVPALIHAGVVVARKKQRGRQVDVVERVGVFAHSFALIIALAMGTVIALLVAMFAMCLVGAGFFGRF